MGAEPLTPEQLGVLKDIASDPFYDDANGARGLVRVRRWLYRQGYIGAIPVEGSDAPVEHLFLTAKGTEVLHMGGKHGP